MKKSECLFCAGVAPIVIKTGADSPAHFTERTPKGSKKPLRRVAGGWRWKDYTIRLLGHEYTTEPPEPPIFNRKWLDWFQRSQRHDAGKPLRAWTLYNGYQIKHTNGWGMIAHWWPREGRATGLVTRGKRLCAGIGKGLGLFPRGSLSPHVFLTFSDKILALCLVCLSKSDAV